jgi:hypothetical protein
MMMQKLSKIDLSGRQQSLAARAAVTLIAPSLPCFFAADVMKT